MGSTHSAPVRWLRAASVLAAAALTLAGCGPVSTHSASGPSTPAATTSAQTSTPETTPEVPATSADTAAPTTAAPTAATPTTTASRPTTKPTTKPTPKPTPTPTPKPTPTEGSTLHVNDTGAYVKSVQQGLSDLGYWLGTPDGQYGGLTEQAVLALQKAAGLGRDGVFGPATRRALEAGTRPHSRIGGTGVEIDKARQLLLVVRGGQVTMILNTSTGSGQPYTSEGRTHIATTPAGWFTVFRSVNGEDVGPLGALWRPRYFNGGIAVHGYTSVPAYPASHGCARVSIAAIDMIWASDIMPIGSRVVVY